MEDTIKWIFGGIGASLLMFILNLLLKKNKKMSINQKQKSGDKSSNTQIGNINKTKDE